MILGNLSEIYQLTRFTGRLAEAGRGVVRVRPELAFASGWLITPTLVVVCDFVLTDLAADATILCDTGDESEAVPGRVVHSPQKSTSGQLSGLIRLARPLAGTQPLRLDLAAAPTGRRLAVLHHPRGLPAAQLSFGLAQQLREVFLDHTADTESGSGGGPVLTVPEFDVVAMHVGSGAEQGNNFALALPAILDGLRAAPDWPEIAEQHQLADVATVRQPPTAAGPTQPARPPAGPALVAAAMRWSFDPAELTEAERESLRPLVVDPKAPRWSLPVPQRQQLLRGAGQLAELRSLRRARPSTEPGAQVVDRILDGPPFDLEREPLEVLPHWLQAVRWFDGVVPELPTAAAVHRTLERRRVRGQLTAVAGPGFRGRIAELATLDAWFTSPRPGPMVVSGIGGVGKSALVARFAELLPAPVPLFWLDFDRVDLAPDDAVSLMTALGAQAAVQLDGFTAPEVDATSWGLGVFRFGAALTAAVPGPALLVLDGFEIAQHAALHQEIWPVLTMLLDAAPRLRLLVSGRAPVSNLQLGGRRAHDLRLTGLDPVVAADWLAERGVVDPGVRDRVVTASRGIPLVLKLAMRLLEAGGSVDELPEVMVEGYLYHRILDRVVDEELRPVARDVLQLRVVTAQMLTAVVPERIPPEIEPAALLERLTHELAIVESLDEAGTADPAAGGLRLRPEVRSAVLRLLTVADPERVVTIDRRAADWWATRATGDPAEAAELVYHRLRLGEVAAAAAAWRAGCADRLLTAADDLADPAARAWLLARLRDDATDTELTNWEWNASRRIYHSSLRGLQRTITRVLDERSERTAASPLLVLDAWQRWQGGDPAGAAALLDAAGPAAGQIARDRTLVRAGLAAAAGDRDTAERLLAGISARTLWAEPVEATAVLAARVRLTVDLEGELELGRLPAGLWTGRIFAGGLIEPIRRLVVPGDVMLPTLAQHVAGLSTYAELRIPSGPEEMEGFAAEVHGMRSRLRERWPDVTPAGLDGSAEAIIELARRVGKLGERRWQLATNTPVLTELTKAWEHGPPTDGFEFALVASLAAFRGLALTLPHRSSASIDQALGGSFLHSPVNHIFAEKLRIRIPDLALSIIAAESHNQEAGRVPPSDRTWRPFGESSGRKEARSDATAIVLIYVLTGDPLLLLIRRVLGLPPDEL